MNNHSKLFYMNEFLKQIFNDDNFGLFFSLSLFLFGCIIIVRFRRLLRVLMKKRPTSKRDTKWLMRISNYMNYKKILWDNRYPLDAGPVKNMYKKGIVKEWQLLDVAVASGMLAGGTLILVGIFIFVTWLIR